MKNPLDMVQNRMEMTEGRVSKHKDWLVEISLNNSERKTKTRIKTWKEPQGHWNNIKMSSFCYIRLTERKKECRAGKIFAVIAAENFPNLA